MKKTAYADTIDLRRRLEPRSLSSSSLPRLRQY